MSYFKAFPFGLLFFLLSHASDKISLTKTTLQYLPIVVKYVYVYVYIVVYRCNFDQNILQDVFKTSENFALCLFFAIKFVNKFDFFCQRSDGSILGCLRKLVIF